MAELKPLLRPLAIPLNAAISVVAPASFASPDRVEHGLERLRAQGYSPALAPHALERGPLYFAGEHEHRLTDLHAAFADQNTRIVAALRGGYGSNYLHAALDLELIRRNPKPFFAYSDLTGIQLRLLDQLNLPTFHGPMVAADFAVDDGVHLPSFHASLAGEPYCVGAREGLRVLKSGSAEGVLYGGCLSILVSLLGTPYEPATEGKLLFLEDVGEKPYQIDRMLWQLRMAGKLANVRGIIFGEMLRCRPAPHSQNPHQNSQQQTDAKDLLERAILSALDGFDGPIAIGLRSGHVSRANVTLTLGVEARLVANEVPVLEMLEPAVQH